MNSITRFILFLALMICVEMTKAQPCISSNINEPNPTKCFEIVSILVDACDGSNEGKNEMIRLKIGPSALLVSTITPGPCNPGVTVNWGIGSSTNPFLGWVNFAAADLVKIDTINKRIKASGNCGVLVPKNKTDYIPASANLLIITSTAYNPTAHEFNGLQDTLYVIIQNPDLTGNQGGHFANFNASSSTRKLVLLSGTCGDTVLYDISKLLTQSLVKGQEDGATVNYTFNGLASYANPGCKIPIPIQKIDAGTVPTSICAGNSINLNGSYSGNHCYAWRAANPNSGTFSDSMNLITTFTPQKNYRGSCKLYLLAKLNCKDYKDSVEFNVLALNDSIRIQKMDTNWCTYSKIPIQAKSTSTNIVTWNTNGAGKIDNPSLQGIVYTPDTLKDKGRILFKVSQTTSCGIIEDSIYLSIENADATFNPDKLVLCKNDAPIALNQKNANGIFSGASGKILNGIFTPSDTGLYTIKYVVSNQACTDTFSQNIQVNGFYVQDVITQNPSCFGMQNGRVELFIAAGKSPFVFQWNTQVNSLNLMQNLKAGTYSIQITDNNACRDTLRITLNEPSEIQFIKTSQFPSCGLNNGSLNFQVKGGTLPYSYHFNNQTTSNTNFNSLSAGTFYFIVVDSHQCKLTDTSFFPISTALQISNSVTADTCNASNGSVTVNINSGTPPYSYNWSPFLAPNPIQYNLPGKSSGMVVVVDGNLCKDTSYYEIPVSCKNSIWIANVFNPTSSNAENSNFGAVTAFPENIQSYSFRIFNRWGLQVFESYDYFKRWDGYFNGSHMPNDVYFYDLTVQFQNENSSEVLKGNVTLLR
jgi:gliding motility-associated-like protein